MPRNTLRPHTVTWGLPGNTTTTAHGGRPSSKQQSHHKLYTMEHGPARESLLSPLTDPASALRRVTDADNAADADPAPAAAPPRAGLAKLAGKVLGAVARTVGLRHGEPVDHAKLLRYLGTPLGAAAAPDEALQRAVSTFTAQLAAEQSVLDAQTLLYEAQGALEVLQAHVDRLQADQSLSARRARPLGDRLHGLVEQDLSTAAELATVQRDLQSAQQLRDTTVATLERTRSDLAGQQGHTAARPAASPASPSLSWLLREETVQDERAGQASLLESQVSLLQDIVHEADESITFLRQRATELEQQRAELAPPLKQAQHLAQVNGRDLWQADARAEELRALLEPAQTAVDARAGSLAAAQAAAASAREAHRAADLAGCAHLLATGGPFVDHPLADALQEALAPWQLSLPQRLSRHGAEALPATLAARLALQALHALTGGDAAQAAALAERLGSTPLSALIPPSGTTPQADEPLLRLAGLLAAQPSGVQVLDLLLAPGESEAPSAMRQEAMRVALLAARPQDTPAPGDAARAQTWREAALRGAARMVHAQQPGQALLDAPADERAAYRGWRNGYQTTEPGSDYDKANQHLKKLTAWLSKSASDSPAVRNGPPTPLDALRDGLTVGAANALPTPRRLAAKSLEAAAGHLNDYLAALRALRPPGAMPSDAELGLQALAYHVQWHPEGTDLATAKLRKKDWRAIHAHQQDLKATFQREARQAGQPDAASDGHPGLASAWNALEGGKTTMREALGLVQRHLQAQAPEATAAADPMAAAGGADDGYWRGQEAALRARLDGAVGNAQRLLRDGDPSQAASAQGLFGLLSDMIQNLEWRDRLRLVGQEARGANLGPLSAALAAAGLTTGIGVKLIGALQHNDDQVMELYMGRTGLYLQLGEQQTRQSQGGAGVNLGYAWRLGDEDAEVALGVGGTLDWRGKRESSFESGIQLRVLRLSGGREPELMVQFMDMFQHLTSLAGRSAPGADGAPREDAVEDWMHEMLAHHDNLNFGLIDNAPRQTTSTESQGSFFAGLRAGKVGERPRRVSLAVSGGAKAKQDQARTETQITGYMGTQYRDSTAQSRVEVQARATAGVQAREWNEYDAEAERTEQIASLSLAGAELGYAAEIRAAGETRFCTLFTRDLKIDPIRTDRAFDFQEFGAFERHVRSDWPSWVQYGTGKLPADMSPGMRYAVAERQLEHQLEQGREFASHNRFSTAYADQALKPAAAPLLDGLRSLAGLQREGGHEALARDAETRFDDLIEQPALWEPTILMLREKPKMQAERGIDFFVKYQHNRIAESMRTVGQWPMYEPVLRRPAEAPAARTWAADPAQPE
jgi:hypothetical protein